MEKKIIGNNIILIKPDPQYISFMFDEIQFSYNELEPWLIWVKKITLKDCEKSCHQYIELFDLNKEYQYYILDKTKESFMGCISLQNIDWNNQSASIGYWISTRFVGKGFISEALGLIQNLADILGLKYLYITCDELNRRSIHVAKRNNYKLAQRIVNDKSKIHMKIRNTLIFEKKF